MRGRQSSGLRDARSAAIAERLLGPGRVRAEDLEEVRLLLHGGERLGDERVVAVAFDIDEEDVDAEIRAGGARFDLREVDRAVGELVQDADERAGTVVRDAERERRLVVAGGRGALARRGRRSASC